MVGAVPEATSKLTLLVLVFVLLPDVIAPAGMLMG